MIKMNKNYIIATIGFMLLAIGLYLVKSVDNPQGIMQALPYVCIGIGCGLFGQGMGNIISQKAIQNNPEVQKQMDIEKNDERNIAIGNRAKGKAFDIMTFVFGALMIAFALMDIELVAILLLVFAYLFIHGCAIYYRWKYDKEM